MGGGGLPECRCAGVSTSGGSEPDAGLTSDSEDVTPATTASDEV